MHRAPALALALALVLSGCGSVGFGAGGAATPYAPPEETPTVGAESEPADGNAPTTRTPAPTASDRGALPANAVERHVAALDNRSLRLRWTDQVVRNRRLVDSTTVAWVAPDGDYRMRTRVGNVTASVYVVDGVLFERYATDDAVRYFRRDLEGPQPTPHDEFLATLRTVAPRGTWERRGSGSVRDGAVVTRYGARVPATERAAITGSEANVTLGIGSEGLVRLLVSRYWVDTPADPALVTRTVSIQAVGETTVRPPEWLPAARNRTTATSIDGATTEAATNRTRGANEQ